MVEWKAIKDICVPLRKEIIKQGDLKEKGIFPVVNSGITLYGYYDKYNNEGNAITIASRGEYAGYVSYLKGFFWAGGLCYPYRSKDENSCITKYIYEYLKSKERLIMDTLVARGGIPALNKADIDKFLIPIPSLSEQTRIVGILDTFTSAINNLKAQIAQRRKQYEYYRDQLLELEGKDGVEMNNIGDICQVITGGEVPEDTIKGQITPTAQAPYAVYTNGKETYGFCSSYKIDSSAVCISSIGANTGAVFYKTGKFTPAIRLKVLLPKGDVDCRFLYYICTKLNFSGRNTGSVPNINSEYVKSKIVPLPSLQEQHRIVSILDTFEASIANLEAQLKQREKQYEYYRNQLLTFE